MNDGWVVLTRVQDTHLYVLVGDFDSKYRDYAERAFNKQLRVQEDGFSEDQLTRLTTSESGVTELSRELVRPKAWRSRSDS